MKPLLHIFFACIAFVANGQRGVLSAGVEQTASGTEAIVAGGFQSRKLWAYGLFHQTRLVVNHENAGDPSNGTWYGLYVAAPLVKTEKMQVYAQLRSGLKDERFVIIVPSIETAIRLAPQWSISVGSSFRHMYPAFLFKTNIHLFNARKR
jgi:hypothetical protein